MSITFHLSLRGSSDEDNSTRNPTVTVIGGTNIAMLVDTGTSTDIIDEDFPQGYMPWTFGEAILNYGRLSLYLHW